MVFKCEIINNTETIDLLKKFEEILIERKKEIIQSFIQNDIGLV